MTHEKSKGGWLVWANSTLARRMTVYGVLFSALTVLILSVLVPTRGEAMESEKSVPSATSIAAPQSSGADIRPAARAIAAVQANQAVASGMVYAPRDVVDMTRLVLEVTRDQATHTAHYIEIATTVIVVFFSVIGAVGAAFGMHKIGDIEKHTEKIKGKIEAEMQEKINALHREINDQSELLTAKAEINTANGDAFVLKNAAQRIREVLDRNQVSKESRIRGLADYAYAIKRTGDILDALKHIKEAADLAKDHAPQMIALLAFNAACYECMLGHESHSLEWLKLAIEKNPDYKSSAKADKDFSKINEHEAFKRLVA
jgi:tetratricopeptide (TPR) repeat protein